MKKKVLALALILVMALTFGLVACGTDTKNVETNLTKIEEVIAELKAALAANKLDLATLEAALSTIDSDLATLDQLDQLAKIVAALQADSVALKKNAIDAYKDLVAVSSVANNTFISYGAVHTIYVGKATVVTSAGAISSVDLDEYFLPTTYATKYTYTNPASNPSKLTDTWAANVPLLDGTSFAKYIQVGNVIFEAVAGSKTYTSLSGSTGSVTAYYKQIATISGGAVGTTQYITGAGSYLAPDLAQYILTNETAAEWYVTNVVAGTFKVLTDATSTTAADAVANIGTSQTAKYLHVAKTTGTAAVTSGDNQQSAIPPITITTASSNTMCYGYGISKKDGKYWPAGNSFFLGWLGNTAAIKEAAVKWLAKIHAYEFYKVGTFNVPGVVRTGATLSDFADYWLLLQAAYIKALS